MNFSVIIPSRRRVPLLLECLESVWARACWPELIEVILVLDHDDKESIDSVNWWAQRNPHRQLIVINRHRSVFLNRDYLNLAAQCSVGSLVAGLNDECLMVTQGWDAIIWEKFQAFMVGKPDRLCYIMIDDDSHAKNGLEDTYGCCFPVVSQESINALNGYYPAEIIFWRADSLLYRIFKSLPVNRILKCLEVKTLHRSHYNTGNAPDETAIDAIETNRVHKSIVGEDQLVTFYSQLIIDRTNLK